MADLQQKQNLDSILTFIFIKKLVTPIVNTDAYKMGLVNQAGRLIRDPENDGEEGALTILDKFIFKIKRILGSKITQLHNFLFLQTLSNDLYNKLIVKGIVDQRAEIKRIQKDVGKIAEKYDCEFLDILSVLLNEELRNNRDIL